LERGEDVKPIIIAASVLMIVACTSEEDAEKACFDKLSADFEASRVFGREQAAAAPFGSDDAVSWSQYALTAAESALSIAVIHSDDDRNACDYVSAGANLERK
jgi:hypothetical protein